MKDKKLEANLSLVVSRIFAGLNMNALKFLLPVWMGALTGVTVRCTFAAAINGVGLGRVKRYIAIISARPVLE